MGIFPHRGDWQNLLARISDHKLCQARHHYLAQVTTLEQRLRHADEPQRTTVRSVLDNFRLELAEVENELARRTRPCGHQA